MAFCTKCGKEIEEGAAFCVACGAKIESEPVIATEIVTPEFDEMLDKEEREFLDNTHRLLRWELKAWSIASKAFLIAGIIIAAFFALYALLGIGISISGTFGGGIMFGIGLIYSILFGGMFIGFGIVSKKAAEKFPQYIETVYSDFSLTYNRCGSIGMLVFNVIFGVVSPIFFIINFVRMKANREVIERILRNQNVQ